MRPRLSPLHVLTWYVHGSYLDSLIHSGHESFLPVRDANATRSVAVPA